ncbi:MULTISPECIES: histidinol-phosphate transaminase [Clostridium]|uniref:histidinol-phosphate transaminase n=1 Tax=Clostridium TaxID=1485 RepID=UPI00069E9C1E|nr:MULTISPECIES: histidinol-phosphate transaminase [Clostridium]KOF56598.1 histidinol-phosphate aminotransferase [Clostridium sp. DMHC 10]MCD2345601.1 histidinol-phosphate transaminase [Clostridium guangxiense]
MSKYWSDKVKSLKPYIPGEQPKDKKYIKLNTNENPYPPSPNVIQAIKNTANDDLKLYPDPEVDSFRQIVANYYGLAKDEVFIGNGSDEVLGFSFMAFFNPGKPILFPDISYSFYKVYANLFDIDYKLVSLDDDFNIPLDEFLKNNGGIVIPNPNAPTAKYIEVEKLEKLLQNNVDSVVIIDEAYIDFGGESCVKLIKDYPNLLVVQTLSKSRSLAGLRVGFAMGSKELITALNMVKNSINSYTIDRVALAGANAAFMDNDYFEDTRKKIIKTRERTIEDLRKIGFKVIDSKANFIFISHPKIYAAVLFKELRDRGILVRYFKDARIDNYLRVSIGTDDEMNKFIKKLKEIIDM